MPRVSRFRFSIPRAARFLETTPDRIRRILRIRPDIPRHTNGWSRLEFFGDYTSAATATPDSIYARLRNSLGVRSENISQTEISPVGMNPAFDEVKVGADPEFVVITDRGDATAIERYVQDPTRKSHLGIDGAGFIGEFRPNPGTAEKVSKNIENLIAQCVNELPAGYEIAGGSYKGDSAIGGHIHISGRGHSIPPQLLKALDYFIAKPLNSVSNYDSRKARGYGVYSSYRTQPHGWEYRSPASWISHPTLTKGVLSIAYWLAKRNETQLAKIKTRHQLLKAMGSEDTEAKEFFDMISLMKRKREKIENIKVFRAWAVEKTGKVVTKEAEVTYPVSFSNDDMMENLPRDLVSNIQNVTLVGARLGRSSGVTIFFPQNISVLPNLGIQHVNLFTKWNNANIGLSYNLRQQLGIYIDDLRQILLHLERID
ncbi:MAG: hypothetical protein HY376_03540 [Candidatus Blackburnbacteria bacterium]|nr:hypothetical protein [Candidatus Blackburnbacteria bacterium]